jgi:hypothetical protein
MVRTVSSLSVTAVERRFGDVQYHNVATSVTVPNGTEIVELPHLSHGCRLRVGALYGFLGRMVVVPSS